MSIPYISLSDEKLMVLYQQGEEQAFEVIYSRYKSKVYSFLSKRIAEEGAIDDVFQAVFMKIHKTKGQYCEDHLVAKWMYVICKSELNDFYRRVSRKSLYAQKKEIDIDTTISSHQSVSTVDIEKYISNQELSRKEREALRLRYQEDLDFQEISKRLNIAESSSRKIISRAIKKLKSIYGGPHE